MVSDTTCSREVLQGTAIDAQQIEQVVLNFTELDAHNYVPEDKAFKKEYVGMRIYDAPIFGYAAADDPCFATLRDPLVVGEHILLPEEWVQGARSVMSFFLPFTQQIKKSNTKDMSWPSDEWQHGRIEGQDFVNALGTCIQNTLIAAGYDSKVPALDKRFKATSRLATDELPALYTSNWSERHVAYICGLGTFGLSKGLITERGVCGRFGSVVTTLHLPPTKRIYNSIYAYCTMCGACGHNCPVEAITVNGGKDHNPCKAFLNSTRQRRPQYYGCGKCQVAVPCQDKIPAKAQCKMASN